jgi:hypothetical protein
MFTFFIFFSALQHLAYEKELEKFTKLLVSGNLQSNETETASKLEKKEKNLLLSKSKSFIKFIKL